jgi:CRP-like cAMP-binding protein
MKQREYNAGDIILREGDPSDVVYRVVSGDVEGF